MPRTKPRALVPAALACLLAPASADVSPVGVCEMPAWFGPAIQDARFGEVVELAGDTALIAAPGVGAVHVWRRGDLRYEETQVLTSPGGGSTGFGASLRRCGEFLAIGAPLDDTAGPDAGAVHVYRLVADVWTYDETLFDPTPAANGRFGAAAAMDGPFLAVGSPGERSAQLFRHDGAVWQPIAALTGGAADEYGGAIAIGAGPAPLEARVFVGDEKSNASGIGAGAVYTHHVLDGVVTDGPVLHPGNPDAGDAFGCDVAFGNNLLLVGARGDDEDGTDAGAAYLYELPNGPIPMDLDDSQKLFGDNQLDHEFGRSVDLEDDDDGGRLYVGSHDYPGYQPNGAIYVYVPQPSGWWPQATYAASMGADDDLGWDFAVDGDLVLVGAPENVEGGVRSGSAHLFSEQVKPPFEGPCPCDVLAKVESYGEGKPGTLGEPDLVYQGPPTVGSTHALVLWNVPAGAPSFAAVGFSPTAIPFDGGTLLVANPLVVEFPPEVLGMTALPVPVPFDPSLCGYSLYLQAFVVDPGAPGPGSTAQSSALRLLLGF